jgi:O-antigen ligase
VTAFPGSAARSGLEAAERADPRGHAMHICLALAWGFLQSITNAGEAITWGLLLAISLARLPKIWRCFLPVWRDPLWWILVTWAFWWAFAGLWGPQVQGRSRVFLPERWMLTPLMLWPVMGRPWLILGAMALGGAVQAGWIAVMSWHGSGWRTKLAANGLSSLSQSQWQTATAFVLSACALRFGSWPMRAAALFMVMVSGLGVIVLAVRTMLAASLAGACVSLTGCLPSRRAAVLRMVTVASGVALVGGALLAWSPPGRSLRASLSQGMDALRSGSGAVAALRASSARLPLAQAALDIGSEHPVVGGGRGAFAAGLPAWAKAEIAADPALAKTYAPFLAGTLTDAHNAILQAWVDGGIPAATLLAALLAGLALRLWRRSRTSPVACTALALYSIVLVNVPGGIITAKSPGALIAVCLAIGWLGLGYRVANPITAPGALPRSRLSALYM